MNNFANTLPYTIGNTNYALLFETSKHNFYDVSTTSGRFLHFTLSQISQASIIEKEYIISHNTDTDFHIWDLTPHENRIDLKCNLENPIYKFYVKGSLNQPIIMKILNSDSIGSFRPYLSSKFDIDINILNNIIPIEKNNYTYELSFQNDWVNSSSTSKSIISYINKTLSLILNIKNGTYTNGTTISTIPENLRPSRNLYCPLYRYNGTTIIQEGFARIHTNGNIQVYGLTSNTVEIYGNIIYNI